MRILVTGASGFIGQRCLTYLLDAGHEVHAVSRKPQDDLKATWHAIDLLIPNAPTHLIAAVEPAAVLHLAWCTNPGTYWSSPDNVRWVQASTELIHASSQAGCTRFVMAGTSAEYDWSSGTCAESITPLQPTSLYGVCKSAVFSILQTVAPLAGMSWCGGRIFNVYGPNEDSRRLVPSILAALMKEGEATVSIVDQSRDFLYVDDVARALVMLIGTHVCGAVNIGSGQCVSVREIAERIAAIVGKTAHIMHSVTSDVRVVQAQNDILTRRIGWKPNYTLDRGLRETVARWQSRL